MIENESQYYAACKERDRITEALTNAMQFGRPSHIDPILWSISTKGAVVRALQLETELREYGERASGLGEKP